MTMFYPNRFYNEETTLYFVVADALHPSHQFFSHVETPFWVEPVLSKG